MMKGRRITFPPRSVNDGIPYPVSQKFSTSANFEYGYGPRSFEYMPRYGPVASRYLAESASSRSRSKVDASTASNVRVVSVHGPATSQISS